MIYSITGNVLLNWRGNSYCVLVVGGFHEFSIKLVDLLIVLQRRNLNTNRAESISGSIPK